MFDLITGLLCGIVIGYSAHKQHVRQVQIKNWKEKRLREFKQKGFNNHG